MVCLCVCVGYDRDPGKNDGTNRDQSIDLFKAKKRKRPFTHTHTHPFNGPLSGTTRVSRYQKGKTNLDFTEARDSERQWNPLCYMQVCTLLRTDNHDSTPPVHHSVFLHAGCPSCRPTNSVKALKAKTATYIAVKYMPYSEVQYDTSRNMNSMNIVVIN